MGKMLSIIKLECGGQGHESKVKVASLKTKTCFLEFQKGWYL